MSVDVTSIIPILLAHGGAEQDHELITLNLVKSALERNIQISK